jgi:hypothetical protein
LTGRGIDVATNSGPWWEQPKNDVDRCLLADFAIIAGHHRERRTMLEAYRAAYRDIPFGGLDSLGFIRHRKSRYPLLSGALDSAVARLITTRPRPQVVTVGGRWKLQRLAKLRQRWLDGEYERLDAYGILDRLTLDAGIYGSGAVKVSAVRNRCTAQRTWIGDLFTDPSEERYPPVMTLYQAMPCSRGQLIGMFPKKRSAIEQIPPTTMHQDAFPDMVIHGYENRDRVAAVEAWRLPFGPDEPGRRVIVSDGVTLVDEDWTHASVPFAFLHWQPDPERFWAQGLIERGLGIQSDLNDLTDISQESYNKFTPYWLIPDGCEVSVKRMTDEIGNAIYYKGNNPPTLAAPPPVAPDFLNREETVAARVMKATGVPELGAMGVKPAGLNSGKAIVAFADETNGRFIMPGRSRERCSMEFAKLLLRTANEVAEQGSAQALRVYGGKGRLEIADYADIVAQANELGDDDVFEVRVFPVSALSNTVSGRLDEVQTMVNLGLLGQDQDQIRELLDMPDLERATDLASARRDAARRQIDKCLDGEQGVAGMYMDLDFAVKHALVELNLADVSGAEEDAPEVMECLRNFLSHAELLRKKASADAAAEQAAITGPPPGPMGPGGPPPPAGPMGPPPEMPPMPGGMLQ